MPCENVTQLAPFLDFIAAHKLTNYSLYLLPLPSLLFEMNECSNDVQCSNTPVMSYAQIVSKKWTPLDTGGNNAAKLLLDITQCYFHTHALIACPHCCWHHCHCSGLTMGRSSSRAPAPLVTIWRGFAEVRPQKPLSNLASSRSICLKSDLSCHPKVTFEFD